MKRFLLLPVLLCSTWIAHAYDFSQTHQQSSESYTLFYQFNPDGESVAVARPPQPYNGTCIEIPATVSHDGKTYDVTAIGAEAFQKASVIEVRLPDSITDIGVYAFDASSLARIKMLANLREIGKNAFSSTKLSIVELPVGVTTIADNAFYSTQITSINLPSTLQYIGSGAFYGHLMTEIDIPGSIGVIHASSFAGAGSTHIENVKIGEGITAIEEYAFNFSYTKNVEFPSTLQSIGYRAFRECNLQGDITIPEGVKNIGGQAFFYNTAMTSVKLPSTLEALGEQAFNSCSSLESINFPASIGIIPEGCCADCTNLSKVEIEEGITHMMGYVFGNCKNLTSIDLPSSLESFTGDKNLPGSTFFGSGLTSFNFPPKVTEIPSHFFANCPNLTTIEIPDHIQTLGDNLFYNCAALKSVRLPEHLTALNAAIFQYCGALTEITLPAQITAIPQNLFLGCSMLKEIIIPEKVTSIGKYAFQDCSALTEIRFPSAVTTISGGALMNCTSLKSVYFSPAITSFGDSQLLTGCTSLENVFMPIGTPPSAQIIGPDNAATLYVPTGSKEDYEASDYWNIFKAIVEMDMDDITFTASTMIIGDGTVSINGENATYTPTKVTQHQPATITIAPTDGWQIESVSLNGVDITNELADNTYTIESVDTNYTLEVQFKRNPVDVVVYSGEYGVLTIPVEYGADFNLMIEGGGDWTVTSVLVNGIEQSEAFDETKMVSLPKVTAPQEIRITYMNATGVAQIAAAGVRIYSSQSTLHIDGLAAGEGYNVFTASGIAATSGVSTGAPINLILNPGEVYVVMTTSGITAKVAL